MLPNNQNDCVNIGLNAQTILLPLKFFFLWLGTCVNIRPKWSWYWCIVAHFSLTSARYPSKAFVMRVCRVWSWWYCSGEILHSRKIESCLFKGDDLLISQIKVQHRQFAQLFVFGISSIQPLSDLLHFDTVDKYLWQFGEWCSPVHPLRR